jgi:predicted phage terminase large subunit-like protein
MKIETNWTKASQDQAYVEVCQEMCRESFRRFVELSFRFVYRKRFRWSKHHTKISRELMLIWVGKQQNLVLNVPPRYSKTELLMLFVAWSYGHNPACEFLHLSYSDKLAIRNSDKVRQLMKSKFYQDMFHVEMDPASDSKGEWRTIAGGIFYATATGGQVTGFGAGSTEGGEFAGAILIDDPLKPDDAYSETKRGFINQRWDATIKSRRNNPSRTPTICIMQRLHEEDFTNELLSDEDEHFKHVAMPAINADGSALWEAKHTVDKLLALKARSLYIYSAQYDQKPTPQGGGVFKTVWFRQWDALPQYFERVIVTADTAGETKTANDFSVFQLWGKYQQKAYLIDQVRGKWEAPELIATATRAVTRWQKEFPILTAVKIEKASVAIGFIQTLRSQIPVPIQPINRTRDKVSRAYSTAPFIQSGMVLFPPDRLAFASGFIKEVESFTTNDSHAHDDQCDPMFDAVSEFFINPEVAGSVHLHGGS